MDLKLLASLVVVVVLALTFFSYNSFVSNGASYDLPDDVASIGGVAVAGTDSEDAFLVSSMYVESLKGYIRSISDDSITIFRPEKTVTLPLIAGKTSVYYEMNETSSAVPSSFPKQGDYVSVDTFINVDGGRHVGTKIVVLKRSALK